MAAPEQKFGIVDTGTSRDWEQAFRAVGNRITENRVCGRRLPSSGFADSPENKAGQEQATVSGAESYCRQSKEILSVNRELFERIAHAPAGKG